MVDRLPSGLYACGACGSEWASTLAAIACEDSHDDDTRRWRHHRHHDDD
ncbi:hypothetical protein [Salana multivorans]